MMTDYEEPAAKISKMEMAAKDHEEEMDEGQEEWLSEGLLTDDDYNPAADQDKSDFNVSTSQEYTTPSIPDDDAQEQCTKDAAKSEDIEQTLDNFENSQPPEIPDELGAFLVRKTDEKINEEKKVVSEIDESIRQSEDDGNDTDELLRMLGEDRQRNKKEIKKHPEQKRGHDSQSSDDDEYIFEGAKVARLRVAKNSVVKKYPTKAVPESISDKDETDMSSDEGLTVKKMFVTRKAGNYASKSTAKPVNATTSVAKRLVTINRPSVSEKSSGSHQSSTTLSKAKLDIAFSKLRDSVTPKHTPKKDPSKKTESAKVKEVFKELPKPKQIGKTKIEPDEIINEEEFLEEDDEFDLDENFDSEPEKESDQRIMRPEQMDEEVPTDGESQSEDDSLYDEFPSSDSDLEEWFSLDVRAERASEYLQLLGTKAHQLLVAEKQRVTARISSLKQNMSALNGSSQQQAEMLRRATMQLAELDAALRA